MFQEDEGTTYILLREVADEYELNYTSEWSCITLQLATELEMVGLTAKFSKALADELIPCNVVAGYYHDHIFVPQPLANKALSVLIGITI